MKRSWLVLRDPDENESGTSSSSADVTADSSSETQTDSTASAEKVEKEPTIAEVAQKAYEASVAKEKQPEPTAEAKAADGDGLPSTETEKEEEKKEVSESTDIPKEGEEQDKGPIPYDRFRTVNEEKRQYEEKVKEYEPLVQAHKSIIEYCQSNQISEEQFRQGMELMRLVNTDPVAARAALEPVWNQLSGVTGDVLPEDLAKEVEEGVLPIARAKEIAKFRGLSKVSAAKTQLSSQSFAQQQQAQFTSALNGSVKSWSDSKKLSDPGFKPKAAPNAPDGKYEFVSDRFYKLMVQNPPKSVPDAIRLLDTAYADISKTFSSMVPRTAATTKSVSSTKSSTNSTKTPTSIKEVVENVLARHKA